MIMPSMSETVKGVVPLSNDSMIRPTAISGWVNLSFSSRRSMTLLKVTIPGPCHLLTAISLESW